MRKRDIPKHLFNIHARLLLLQLLLFTLLEITHDDHALYTASEGLMIFLGLLLFPFIASRNIRARKEAFQRYTSPGSELLQIGMCGLLLSIHFNALWFAAIPVILLFCGIFLLARYQTDAV